MPAPTPPPEVATKIDGLVNAYKAKQPALERFRKAILSDLSPNTLLDPLIHSIRSRLKDPEHLRDKLVRQWDRSTKHAEAFTIDEGNLFTRINDLMGVRILHLHSSQIDGIDAALKQIFRDCLWEVIEGPVAMIWDEDYKKFYESRAIAWKQNERMYTSVHYVVRTARDAGLTGEIQVRTLAEELWGEVDHAINYPHPSTSVTCQEQIRVLARLTSGCTRLVDATFRHHSESVVGASGPVPPLGE